MHLGKFKAAPCWALRCEGKGVYDEARWGLVVSTMWEEHRVVVRQRGGVWQKSSLLVLVLYAWKELRAAGLFWLCFGFAWSWNYFIVNLQGTKGGKAPAGEMWHIDKADSMMGKYAMAPRELAKSPYRRIGRRGRVISSERRKAEAAGCVGIQVDTLTGSLSKPILANEHWGLEYHTHLYSIITANTMDHLGHLQNRHWGEDCSCLIKTTFEAICCLNASYPSQSDFLLRTRTDSCG